jgi:hypothetical protein
VWRYGGLSADMPCATISAIGSRLNSAARAALVTMTAAPPLEICDAFPAVIVPSGPKAGRKDARDSVVMSPRMPSSASKVSTAPFRPATSRETISWANAPRCWAEWARWCERAAHSSCSRREIPSSLFTWSDWWPMVLPENGSRSPSKIIESMISASPMR